MMTLGKVIRKYRKGKSMTQEEMAARLGVSAPAVNKWENENSYPDIMLLAPIGYAFIVSGRSDEGRNTENDRGTG